MRSASCPPTPSHARVDFLPRIHRSKKRHLEALLMAWIPSTAKARRPMLAGAKHRPAKTIQTFYAAKGRLNELVS
jgi:hypothetical protein